jgi:hypothetical protein
VDRDGAFTSRHGPGEGVFVGSTVGVDLWFNRLLGGRNYRLATSAQKILERFGRARWR